MITDSKPAPVTGSDPFEPKPAVESGESSGLAGSGGAKILHMRAASDFPVVRREKARCRCSTVGERWSSGELPSVWVDEATRAMECKKCGARLEAFDYVWALAIEGDGLGRDIRQMRETKQALKAQLSLLNEQIRELKSEGRKLAKAPKKEAGGGGAEQAGDRNAEILSRAASPNDPKLSERGRTAVVNTERTPAVRLQKP